MRSLKTTAAVAMCALVTVASSTASAQPRAVSQPPVSTNTLTEAAAATKPLAGLVIAIDPGHQLGNGQRKFAKQINEKRFNGRIWKICNTTGTATNSGFPEATFTWRVALALKVKLERLGATVRMTRTANSVKLWGPCTWDRGTFGQRVGARLMIQIHADGAPRSAYGFHIITPALTRGWTDGIWKRDLVLAKAMKAGLIKGGLKPSTYIKGAISIRGDQTAMNVAKVPTVTVELGNMRNPIEAARMQSSKGQAGYASALLTGIRTYLNR